jgi:flagellar motor switch protein FliM
VQPSSTRLLSRVDEDTLRRLRDWLGDVLRAQRVRLVNRVGTDVSLSLDALDVRPVGALTADRELRFMATARLDPCGLDLVVGVDAALLSHLFGALLGVAGGAAPDRVDRALTRTDLRVGRRIVDDLLHGLELALPSGCPERAVVTDIGATRRLRLGAPGTTAFACARITVTTADGPLGAFTLAFPVTLAAVLWPGRGPAQRASGPDGDARVLPMHVEAVAELGRIRLPLARVDALLAGDTLDLGRLGDVVVRVRGEPALRGEAGVVDGVRCVRIRERTQDRGT